jgi:hypothetical protein
VGCEKREELPQIKIAIAVRSVFIIWWKLTVNKVHAKYENKKALIQVL